MSLHTPICIFTQSYNSSHSTVVLPGKDSNLFEFCLFMSFQSHQNYMLERNKSVISEGHSHNSPKDIEMLEGNVNPSI